MSRQRSKTWLLLCFSFALWDCAMRAPAPQPRTPVRYNMTGGETLSTQREENRSSPDDATTNVMVAPAGTAVPTTTVPPAPSAPVRVPHSGLQTQSLTGANRDFRVNMLASQLDGLVLELSSAGSVCRDVCRASGGICNAAFELCELTGELDTRCGRAREACERARRQRDGACPVCPRE